MHNVRHSGESRNPEGAYVIPADAGIQGDIRHSRGRGNPGGTYVIPADAGIQGHKNNRFLLACFALLWFPACARMTGVLAGMTGAVGLSLYIGVGGIIPIFPDHSHHSS